jgi:hypothetical protein
VLESKHVGIGGGIGFAIGMITHTPTLPGLALAERTGAGLAWALLGAGIGAFVWWLRLKKFPVLSRTRILGGLSVLLLLVSTAAGWAWLSRPGDYDECILQNMKGATVREAAWAIEKSCRAKFPEACYAWLKKGGYSAIAAEDDPEYAEYLMRTWPAGCSEELATP